MGFWDNFWPAHLGFWGVPGISNTPRKISPLGNPQNGTQPASLLEIFPTLRTSSYFFHIPSIAIKKKWCKINGCNGAPFLWTTGLRWIHVIWHAWNWNSPENANWNESLICVCHPCAMAMLTVMSTNLNASHSSLDWSDGFTPIHQNHVAPWSCLHGFQKLSPQTLDFSVGLHSLGNGLQPKLFHVDAVDRQWSPSCHPVSETTECAVHVEEVGLHSIIPAAP